MSNFDVANIALKAVCPNNEMLYDDKGFPSVMVKIPKQTWAQLGVGSSTEIFPAWIVNGQEVDCIYFPKYQNVVSNERAYSLPGQDPRTYVTLDQAINYSANKGEGWHVCTRLEWMAVALWCLKNGTQPLGNNNYGRDVSESLNKAVPTYKDNEGKTCRVATGTGPIEWSHDRTLSGIWDLNGNVWEWNGGVRFVKGELQVISSDGLTFGNDAADTDNSQSVSSALWRAIDGTTGALIAPNGTGTTANSLKLDWVSGVWKWITGTFTEQADTNRNCNFESIKVDETVCETAQHKLQALGMYKSDTTSAIYNGDNFWCNNGADELAFFAGGSWHDVSMGGVFAGCGRPRSHLHDGVGFRSAFVKLPRI